jgi:hypothetical protein
MDLATVVADARAVMETYYDKVRRAMRDARTNATGRRREANGAMADD